MTLFQQQQPVYISIRKEQFVIDNIPHDYLSVFIVKTQPIRKFFRDGKLQCYSMDAKISRNKKYCVFCDDAWRCHKKIRLSMFETDTMQPFVLDINPASFQGLQKLLEQYNDSFDSIPVTLKIIYDEQDLKVIEFIPDDTSASET